MTRNPSYIAEEDLKPARIVKMGAGDHGVVHAAAATDEGVGITHNGTREAPIPGIDPLAAKTGETPWVHGEGVVCEVLAGAAIAVGDNLTASTVDLSGVGLGAAEPGVAIVATGTNPTVARALAAAAQGEMCSVQVLQRILPGT